MTTARTARIQQRQAEANERAAAWQAALPAHLRNDTVTVLSGAGGGIVQREAMLMNNTAVWSRYTQAQLSNSMARPSAAGLAHTGPYQPMTTSPARSEATASADPTTALWDALLVTMGVLLGTWLFGG